MPEKESQKNSQTLETKGRILKAALKLFNEHGTGKVTTHDVAAAANISPGNLYYHFKNKEALIRALFYQIDIFSVNEWAERSPAHREVRFIDFVSFFFGDIKKYRFFFREFSSILTNDPILAREWKSTYNHLFSIMKESLAGWVKQGLIKPFRSPKESNIFIETVWILSSFSQIHFEAREGFLGSPTPLEAQQYIARFMYPYHTAKGQRALDLYL